MRMNELEVMRKVEQDLRDMGFPIVRNEVMYKSNSRRIADIVAYTINEEGALTPEVVVEIRIKPVPRMQNKLQENAVGLGSKFALLVVGTEYYWYSTETFLPIEPPKRITTYGIYLVKKEDIVDRTSNILKIMIRQVPTSYERTWILGYSLIIRFYLYKIGSIQEWRNLVDGKKYIETLKQAFDYIGLNTDDLNQVPLRNIGEDLLGELVEHLDEFPPASPILGEVFLETIASEVISSGQRGQLAAPKKVRELVRIVAKSIEINDGEVIDLTTGVGALLYDVSKIIKAKKFIGIEVTKEVAILAQMMMVLSQRENVEIFAQDAVQFAGRESSYKLVICDPPFGGRILTSKNGDLSSFKVTQGGKRLSVEPADLLIEKTINLAEPGGNIIVIVAEGMLFKSPSLTRDFIRDETYIEGIISLPTHTYKPYSAVKTSLLILRKKKLGESEPINVFLGNPQSLDEIEEVGNAFVEWKKGVFPH